MTAMRLFLASLLMGIEVLTRCLISPPFYQTFKDHFNHKRNGNFLGCVFIMGLFNNAIPFSLVAWAESRPFVNSGVASVLDSTIPIFSQIIGHFVLHTERFTWNRVVGILVGFLGVLAVCAEKVFHLRGDSSGDVSDIFYYFLIIIASASYAIASIFGKKFCADFHPVLVAAGQIISAFFITCVVSLCWEFQHPIYPFPPHYAFIYSNDIKAWISLLYLSVFGTYVAYALFFYLLRTIGSVKQTMVGFLLPVFGVFEGVVFNGDWKGATWLSIFLEVLGALLVILSIYFVNYLGARRN
eukprot:Sdes_comp20639_c0_seq1m15812